MSSVIMRKNANINFDAEDMESIENYLQTKPVTLVLPELDKETSETSLDEKEIILYLSRNKKRNFRLNAFSPNSFEHLSSRNAAGDRKKGHDNYERLKIKLKDHEFYAFNRFRQNGNEVAIFSYTFEFNDNEKVCLASRHPIGSPNKTDFKGEIYLLAEKIIFNLRDDIGQRYKQFIAPFNCVVDDITKSFVFKGITSTISSLNGNPMALRELIVCIPKPKDSKDSFSRKFSNEDMTNGYISYEDFRDELPITILKQEEKLFLANQNMSTLTFPSKTDAHFTYYRLDKARKYEGTYHIFTYGTNQNIQLLHMELSIDSLSEVELKIKFKKQTTDKPYIYKGVCEYYNSSLRIGVHYSSDYPNDERHAEFIFDPITEIYGVIPNVLAGKNLITDAGNKSLSMNFLAINHKWLEKLFTSSGFQNKKEDNFNLGNIGEVDKSNLVHLNKWLVEDDKNNEDFNNFIQMK